MDAQPSSNRRLVRYSLRAFVLGITLVAGWIGYRSNSARQQRAATAAIVNASGYCYLNWQLKPIYGKTGEVDYFKVVKDPDAVPAPKWLRSLVGDEYFQHVVKISIHPDRVDEDILLAMSKLPRLNSIDLTWSQHNDDDTPKLSRENLAALTRKLREQFPNASVWSRGL